MNTGKHLQQHQPFQRWQLLQDIIYEREWRRAILDSANLSIISTDPEGIIQTFNPAAEKLLGYSAEEIVNTINFCALHDPKEVEEHALVLSQKLQRTIEPGFQVFVEKATSQGVEEKEWSYIRKDGSRLPVSLSVTALRNSEGIITGFLGIAHDISSQKEAEEKMRAATEAKSQFIANMSHEIRTPITSIIGFTETMLTMALSAEEQRNAQNVILRNGRHLLGIISDILDLSKIEAGKLEVESLDVPLFDLISDVENLMKYKALEKDLSLRFEPAYPLPLVIRTDPTRLKQILVNVIGNAIKFTETGEVKIVVSCRRTKEAISFAVIDTGIGLTGEQQTRLFNAFSQADTSVTRQFGGTGLGLIISQQLAQKLGGGLSLESTHGQGSVFTVTVATGTLDDSVMIFRERRVPSLSAAQVQPKPPLENLSGKVLLVEDGPDNQQLISFLLRRAGMTVVIAENGERAVQAAMSDQFDLVLMDIQMPVMDGITATQILRKKGYTTPIIALTANVMKGDIKKYLQLGCNDYIGKPFERGALLAKVMKFFKNNSSLQDTTAVAATCAGKSTLEEITEEMIISSFRKNLPTRIQSIEEACKQGDWKNLEMFAHRLRGAAAFGFPHLGEIAGNLENAALAQSESNSRRYLEELRMAALQAAAREEGQGQRAMED